ncbi:hypothetical protein H6G64_17190 [Calothrix sp. FACHB-156]|nr:hypothetical protein [Nostoc linckia FACHB-104]MBD2338710.1 hypothetical protein [Calothrix sp. FACHB-156]
MSNELFTEVNVNQQEVVTGGASASVITVNSFEQLLAAAALSSANKNGATSAASFSEITKTYSSLLGTLIQ